MRVLVTGGAGFVGSSLCLLIKQDFPQIEVVAFDNLKRRGSELILSRLKAAGVNFCHGDVRVKDDLAEVDGADLVLDCAAEPSVHAGYSGGASYLVHTNLMGTANILEYCRIHKSAIILLSTSRVYPIAPLRALPLSPHTGRLHLGTGQQGLGWSEAGIREDFPMGGARSLYGASKLASELLVEEYREMFGLTAVINRCGVLTGPWQMGKVDQGFVVLWAARHLFGGKLSYMGFGGEGLQVRDMLHVRDLYALIRRQWEGGCKRLMYNVGGGLERSVSLQEATALCEARSGQRLVIDAQPETRAADIPWYITDSSVAQQEFAWAPNASLSDIFDEVFDWLRANETLLKPILMG